MTWGAPIEASRLPGLRRRMLWTLFAISAFGTTGYIAAVTAGTLVAADMAGTSAGGLPTTTTTIGTAAAASFLSLLMLRYGRRPGMLVGIAVGALGGVTALAAVLVGSLPLLLLGSAMTGFANGAGQLGRYIAADTALPERRAATIGTVVWGQTVGAVTGPNLVAPAGAIAESVGLPALAGAYLLTMALIGVSLLVGYVFLRPEPYLLADESALRNRDADTVAPSLRSLFAHPAVGVALVTLVAGQVVMVLIMTMTPLHLSAHGHGLGTVGLVLSAHTFGMFALSPITGRLTDRFGSPRIIAAGLGTLGIAAVVAALAPPEGGALLTLALFLLGYGWNLGFVAGSALLTQGLPVAERTRVQGIADALTWTTAALASLSSGVIVEEASYTALGFLGLGLLVVPVLLLLARGRGIARATA
jgi:MFS family permease